MNQKYRIMIVDDEADMREGIAHCIPWGSLNFEVAAEAENGQDALDKLESTEVDVLLTDIKMPFLDGIALAERVSALYPGIKIIILTGFDEFEYAKAAIKLNVVEYILKPINSAELSDVIRRVGANLDRSLEQQRNMDILMKNYENSVPMMREHFITELLWGILTEVEIQQRFLEFNLPIQLHSHYIVALFQVEAQQNSEVIRPELVPISIKDMVCSQFDGQCDYVTFLSSKFTAIITSWEQPDQYDRMILGANEICLRCDRVLGLAMTAGVGRCYQSPAMIHRSFLDANEALEYRQSMGSGRVIFIEDMETASGGKSLFDGGQEEYIRSLLKFGTAPQINEMADNLLVAVAGATDMEKRAYMAGLYEALYSISRDHGLDKQQPVEAQLIAFFENASQWSDTNFMREGLLRLYMSLHEAIQEGCKSASRVLAETAVQYIAHHYSDSQLSVEQLCQQFHVSQTYFSTVFKQVVGESFVRYLTNLRMQHAQRLLEQMQDKTYVIAAKVGYEEPNYFSYVYKKHFGISPTKYRSQLKEQYENSH